ncbi:superoxide dismutase copper chaperone [Fadolivirus algeromassiliense]|jgi:Cu-Zn family superoxide dismutase|uniref:Superoxide dismutase copper chaperone n=1 Tax=Fadolivirus FV1/VV64 TaxID=3070911 RepID=A0A7D3V5C3_9VIRU|nr:superoxide dismutase copper chaperone [Fadolivirus algeromassiliense]QKF93612.1 superoxide dismutase copper chaperone [Fadolivirus FV1/VV64]
MGNSVTKNAIAQIRSHDDTRVLGYIHIDTLDNGNTYIHGELSGLSPGKHAIHIHEKGNPQKCCSGLGDHYNPFNKQHGDRTAIDMYGNKMRHVGDLGNIIVKNDGSCKFAFEDDLVKITGQYSVIGRSIVIHENEDDLGLTNHPDSKKTGNSGKRIAYGIIGYA